MNSTLISISIPSFSKAQDDLKKGQSEMKKFVYKNGINTEGFIRLITCGRFHISTPATYRITSDPCYHLIYIYDGSLMLETEGRTIYGTSSSVLLINTSKPITYTVTSGSCRYFEAYMTGESLAHYYPFLPDSFSFRRETSGASTLIQNIDALCIYPEELEEVDVFRISKWINDIFTEFCVFNCNSSKREDLVPEYLGTIKQRMDRNYSERHSLTDLEDEFGISQYRICREFSKHFGISPIHYLNKVRIKAAKKLLLTSDLTVREVGSAVGIDNTSHFINLFKKETGTTPLSFKHVAPVSISELHYSYIPGVRQQ